MLLAFNKIINDLDEDTTKSILHQLLSKKHHNIHEGFTHILKHIDKSYHASFLINNYLTFKNKKEETDFLLLPEKVRFKWVSIAVDIMIHRFKEKSILPRIFTTPDDNKSEEEGQRREKITCQLISLEPKWTPSIRQLNKAKKYTHEKKDIVAKLEERFLNVGMINKRKSDKIKSKSSVRI